MLSGTTGKLGRAWLASVHGWCMGAWQPDLVVSLLMGGVLLLGVLEMTSASIIHPRADADIPLSFPSLSVTGRTL